LIVLFYIALSHIIVLAILSYIQQSSCSAVQLQACNNKVELSSEVTSAAQSLHSFRRQLKTCLFHRSFPDVIVTL